MARLKRKATPQEPGTIQPKEDRYIIGMRGFADPGPTPPAPTPQEPENNVPDDPELDQFFQVYRQGGQDALLRYTAEQWAMNRMHRIVDECVANSLADRAKGIIYQIDYKPENYYTERVERQARSAIYAVDPNAPILCAKVLTTTGTFQECEDYAKFNRLCRETKSLKKKEYANAESNKLIRIGIEAGFDLEVITDKTFNRSRLLRELIKIAHGNKEKSLFLARVMGADEQFDPEYDRPGIEIYFDKLGTVNTLKPVLKQLHKQGMRFSTTIVDVRWTLETIGRNDSIKFGIRFMYMPEYELTGPDDPILKVTSAEIGDTMTKKADELGELADRIAREIPGITLARPVWFNAEVFFNHEFGRAYADLAGGRSKRQDPAARA